MSALVHFRVINLLAAALTLLWPVAAAQACCCGSGAKPANDGECSAGCCDDATESCCLPAASDDGHCCTTSDERDACGCSHDCGQGEIRQPLNVPLDKSGQSFAAALPADGWLITSRPVAEDFQHPPDAADILQRPKRILYGVWRN